MSRNYSLPVLAVLSFFGFAGSSAQADDAGITDLTYVGAQLLPADDPKNIDAPANKFKFVKVFFRTGSDLAALSKANDRDVHIAAYRCDYKAMHANHDNYTTDPVVYDAYGAVTRNRSVTKTDASERFKGIYYFFLPTTSLYGQVASYIFEPAYDLYTGPQDMCFEIPGSSSNYFSNEATVTAAQLQTALSKRPH